MAANLAIEALATAKAEQWCASFSVPYSPIEVALHRDAWARDQARKDFAALMRLPRDLRTALARRLAA